MVMAAVNTVYPGTSPSFDEIINKYFAYYPRPAVLNASIGKFNTFVTQNDLPNNIQYRFQLNNAFTAAAPHIMMFHFKTRDRVGDVIWLDDLNTGVADGQPYDCVVMHGLLIKDVNCALFRGNSVTDVQVKLDVVGKLDLATGIIYTIYFPGIKNPTLEFLPVHLEWYTYIDPNNAI